MSQIAHPKRLNYPFKTLVGMLCCTGSASAMADIGTAKNWLANTVPNSQVANPLQATQEMATSLNHLKANVSLNQAIATVDNETSTEGLVRLILIAKANNTDLPTAWQTLINNQNDDGGFGHIEGWQSNPLDTAYVLIALNESHYVDGLDATGKADWQNRINQALAYLASQQQSNGSYQINYLDDLYINSYILSAYTPYLKQYGQYVPTVQKIVTYLQSKQTSAGTWSARGNNTGLFIDALVAESLYPYQNSDTATAFKTAFTNRALALQNADGSWQQDAYVTAVVLRALDDLAKTTTNPITSGVSATILDAETGLPLSNVVVQTGTTTATSDAQGNVSLANLAAGSYQLSITREGYTTVNVSVTLKQGEQLNLGQIKLSRAAAASNGQIQGTIIDKTTGNAVANAVVTVVLVDATGKALPNFTPIVTTTNAQGQYQIVLTAAQQAASAGNFGINVSGAGYSAVAGSGVAQAGAVTMFSPSLSNPASATSAVSAKVVDEKGQPLGNVSVMEAGQPLGVSDAQGLITVAQVGQGSHQWQFSVSGHQTSIVSLTVNGSTSTNLGTITLATLQLSDPSNPNSQPLPPVQGNFIVTPVDSTSNKPIDGFTVTAEQLDSNNQVIQTQSFTPSSNQTANATLPAGKWRLTVSQDAYQSASQVFDLADKQTLSYQPKLSLSPYAISGNVVDSISNQPISNAPFSIADNSTNTVIFTGITDSQGNFTTQSNLTAANARITINPATYLPTTRLISRSYEKDPTIVLGQIRLRPKSADIVLPDLYIDKLITDKKITDSQTLLMSGEMGVVVGNKGNTGMVDKPTKILAFVDANHDHKYEAGEQIVGSTTVNLTLAQGEQTTVSLPVSGKLNFKDAPIAVMVDSDGQIAESNENNNVRISNEDLANPINFNNKRDLTPNWSLNNEGVLVSPLVSSFTGKASNERVNGVFYINQTGTLKAVDGRDGKELWQNQLQLNQNNISIDRMVIASLHKNMPEDKYIFVTDVKNKRILQINLLGETTATIDIPLIDTITTTQLSFYYNNDNKLELITDEGIYDTDRKKWTFFKKRDDQLVHGGNILSFFDDTQNQQLFLVNGTLYKEDGNILLNDNNLPVYMTDAVSTNDSYVLGDFDNDGFIDIATKTCSNSTANSKLNVFSIKKHGSLMQLTGNNDCRFKESLITTDFNGDKVPDLFYDGKAILNDGSLLWQLSRDNFESLQAASFDFNNDGKNEFIVNRAQGMYIYDGLTGAIKWSYNTKTGANSPNPIIADLNGDGTTDILLPSSNAMCTDLMDFKDSPLNNTDTKVLIRWGGGPDLDINTEFDNTRYGWNYNSSRTPYIQWLGDNTSGGPERVMLNAEQAFKDNVGIVNNSLVLNIGAAWYSSYGTDNWAQLEVATKDGRCFSGYLNNIKQPVYARNPEYKIAIPEDKNLPITAENLLTGTTQAISNSAKILAFYGRADEWGGTRNFWNSEYFNPEDYENNEALTQSKTKPIHTKGNIFVENILKDSDLTTSYLRVIDKGANGSQFIARIGNAGGKTVAAGTPVSFYQKDSTGQSKLLGVIKLPKDLASDDYSDLTLDYTAPTGSLNGFGELVVIANDAGAGVDSATGIPNPTDPNAPVSNQGVIQEYTRSNNLASIAVTGDFSTFSLAANLDKTNYTANQTVTITSIPANLGSFATKPTLKVTILDSAGNVVNQYPDQQVSLGVAPIGVPLGNPPENSTTVQNFWNITNQRVGNYTAHVELINNNQTVASVDKPFAIVADGVAAAQVQSQLMVDKTQYNTTDLIQLQSRLINSASNAMATARTVTLSVKDSTGNQIWTQSYSYAELPPNALKDQYFTVPLKNVPAGQYTVTSITTANDGSQTPQTLTKNVEVVSAAQTGANISGTLQAPASAEIGTAVAFNWTVNNGNAQVLTNVPAAVALYRGEENTPFTTLPLNNLTLNANGSVSGSVNWNSTGNDGDKITAVLTANFGNATKTLALSQTNLTQVAVKASLSTQDNKDTLLVYYSCEDGWYTSLNNSGAGKFDYPCFNARETTIRSYLDRMGINYKLVKTPWDFRQEMQSGIYGQYWLLGALEELSPHTYNEISELTNTGENLLIDSGMHSWLNYSLYNLAGVTYNGRLLLETGEISPNPSYLPPSSDSQIANTPLATQTKLSGQPFNSNWAIILKPNSTASQPWAVFKGSPKQIFGINQNNYPNQTFNALTATPYGNGVPVVGAFDIISSLDYANHSTLPPYKNNANALQLHWDEVLNKLLISRQVKPRSDYAPREPVKIPLSLVNDATTERRIQVDVVMPTGSDWLGYQGGVNTTPSTTLDQHYQLTLKPKQTLQDVVAVRLPQASGTYAIQITVTEITDPAHPKKVQQLETRYLVRSIDDRVALLKKNIDTWQVIGTNGYLALNAKTQIGLIQTHLNTGVDELAVYEAGRLTQTLAQMQPTTTQNTVALRYEADELLRALQIKWYLARNGKPPLP